jgi:hypothetical protein
MKKWFLILFVLIATSAEAAKVAVTDLTYSQRVSGYIHIVDYHNTNHVNASSQSAYSGNMYGGGGSAQSHVSGGSSTDYFELEHSYTYIEYGELRKFVADIKGEMIKSRSFQLVQAKPVTNDKTESIYDIIDRIKKGYYPNADYVLFGTVSDINFADNYYQAANSNVNTNTFNLTLIAEFSLINTKTYEVIAAFSATGEGNDTKIISPGTHSTPNRARVVSDVSKSLGIDVIHQLDEQVNRIPVFNQVESSNFGNNSPVNNDSNIMVFH